MWYCFLTSSSWHNIKLYIHSLILQFTIINLFAESKIHIISKRHFINMNSKVPRTFLCKSPATDKEWTKIYYALVINSELWKTESCSFTYRYIVEAAKWKGWLSEWMTVRGEYLKRRLHFASSRSWSRGPLTKIIIISCSNWEGYLYWILAMIHEAGGSKEEATSHKTLLFLRCVPCLQLARAFATQKIRTCNYRQCWYLRLFSVG